MSSQSQAGTPITMLPKTKGHLTKKCYGYKANSTPFRKHGKKAYVRGYMHGFCHKINMFAEGSRPNNVEFVLFVEIMEVDWAPNSNDAKSLPDVPATPSKKDVKPDVASSRSGKRKIAFDPFADLNTGSSLMFEEKLARSDQKTARGRSICWKGLESSLIRVLTLIRVVKREL